MVVISERSVQNGAAKLTEENVNELQVVVGHRLDHHAA